MAGLDHDADGRAAASSTEAEVIATLTELWSSELGIDQVRADEDFYDLGGHSLLAMALADRIALRFQVDFSANDVARLPTIAEEADEICAALHAVSGSGPGDADPPRRD